jgi:NADP-reducing hydrogenase subunit HndA
MEITRDLKNHKVQLSENAIALVKKICRRFNYQEGELINILHAVQNQFGYLPAEIQELIAKELDVSVAKVYGVVTFYSFFTMKPKGKYPISLCMGTACYVRGAENILNEIKRQLNIDEGETTPDGLFSLSSLRCVGACGLAPVLMVGEKVYGRVAQADVRKIISEYKAGCPTHPSKE